jgi:hypothetical protein
MGFLTNLLSILANRFSEVVSCFDSTDFVSGKSPPLLLIQQCECVMILVHRIGFWRSSNSEADTLDCCRLIAEKNLVVFFEMLLFWKQSWGNDKFRDFGSSEEKEVKECQEGEKELLEVKTEEEWQKESQESNVPPENHSSAEFDEMIPPLKYSPYSEYITHFRNCQFMAAVLLALRYNYNELPKHYHFIIDIFVAQLKRENSKMIKEKAMEVEKKEKKEKEKERRQN